MLTRVVVLRKVLEQILGLLDQKEVEVDEDEEVHGRSEDFGIDI